MWQGRRAGPATRLNGLLYGRGERLGRQIVAVTAVMAFAGVATYPIGPVARATIGLRVTRSGAEGQAEGRDDVGGRQRP